MKKKENVTPEPDEILEPAADSADVTAETEQEQIPPVPDSELETLREELKKQTDLLLRTAAEYENYRKRTKREREMFFADAKAITLTPLLPVFDSLDRAIETEASGLEDYKKGMEMVETQLRETLKHLGVEELGSVGEGFDPEKHNAVSHEEKDGAEENTIAQVLQKGYSIDGKILRHAVVSVYK